MNILIITAHPGNGGFTKLIAENYKKGHTDAGNKAEIVDLYADENAQPFLTFGENMKYGEDKNRKIMQDKITWADQLVFIFPIWWGQVPAIMKNFFDTNFENNFAFRYTKKGQEGLLKGKTARVFATCDAPGFIYKLFIFPNRIKGYFKMYLLGFCGIKTSSFHLFDSMRKRDDASRKITLDTIYNMGNK